MGFSEEKGFKYVTLNLRYLSAFCTVLAAIYQPTQRYNPEDHNLHTYLADYFKIHESFSIKNIFVF